MAELPDRARIVIVGGGVGGASVAYHLARRGERDVLLVERAELTSGSTFHSAGLVGQLRADPALTRMNVHSVALYRRAGSGPSTHPGWVESGSLRLASSPERLVEIRRQAGWAQRSGLPLELISADEARGSVPADDDRGRAGRGVHADRRPDRPGPAVHRAGGRGPCGRGADRPAHPGGGVRHGRRRRRDGASSVCAPIGGDVECEVVVDCGGMYAAEIAALVDVRIPVVPMSHQYVVTAPLPAGTLPGRPLPSLRDPDLLVYYRQEIDGLRDGRLRAAARVHRLAVATTPPADFNGKLLAPDWDRFAEILDERPGAGCPLLADVGVASMINGPEGFTPDNEFCLGETEVAGFFVAAGFCAHGIAGAGGIGDVMANWILDGDPGLDLWHMDVRRFGRHYRSPGYTLARVRENYESYYDIRYPGAERAAGRPLRTSPAYAWHAAHGAVFGEKAGWERVNHYSIARGRGAAAARVGGAALVAVRRARAPRGARGGAGCSTRARSRRSRSPVRTRRGSARGCSPGTSDRPPGAVVYTQALNERGGIEMDVTVSRLAADEFLLVTGTAFGRHDLGWLRRQARLTGADVRIADVTSAWACFGLWGPQARELLAPLTQASLANADFPYPSMRETTVGGRAGAGAARHLRRRAGLGAVLPDGVRRGAVGGAGGDRCARRAGTGRSRACGWRRGTGRGGVDIGPETTPAEAGPGVRRAARRPASWARRRCGEPGAAAAVPDPGRSAAVALGGEPVRLGDTVVGQVTSGGYGYTVARSIAYAYLPVTASGPAAVAVDGDWVAAEVATGALYDPKGARIRL